MNLLDEIPEAIPETRETTFFDLDMVKEFRGGWFSRFEKALSAFDYNSRETLAARSGEIKSALENNLKAVARRELTGFYDYQKWLTCLCRQRIDVSLESREIDAVNREIRRDKVAREKEAFLNSLDNPDFVDRLFDNPIYLKGVISDCLREGIPFELVRVKKAVLAKFADDFSTLVNLEYLQKLDEVAKVLGFVSSRDEEVTEFLEKSDDPILRSLASKQLATPEASTQQPNKVSDNADAFADFVATSIMKYFYSNNLFTPEIQSKFGVASFWLGLRNNVSIAYRSLRLFGRAFSFVSATERSEIFEKHFRNKAFPGNIFIAPGAYLEALGLYLTTGEQAAKARIVKALENGEYNFIESVLIALLRKYHRVENAESHRDENFKILELTQIIKTPIITNISAKLNTGQILKSIKSVNPAFFAFLNAISITDELISAHTISASDLIISEFALSFTEADIVKLLEIYSAGEKPIPGVTSALILDGIKADDSASNVGFKIVN